MALALAIRPEHNTFDDIEVISVYRFRDEVRDLCGLFVTIVDSRIYLLH
jgi:ankyrin repeat domain-containing protein 50